MFATLPWSLPVLEQFDHQILPGINQSAEISTKSIWNWQDSHSPRVPNLRRLPRQGQGRMSGSLFSCSLPRFLLVSERFDPRYWEVKSIWNWQTFSSFHETNEIHLTKDLIRLFTCMSSPRLCWHILVLVATTRWREGHRGSSPAISSRFHCASDRFDPVVLQGWTNQMKHCEKLQSQRVLFQSQENRPRAHFGHTRQYSGILAQLVAMTAAMSTKAKRAASFRLRIRVELAVFQHASSDWLTEYLYWVQIEQKHGENFKEQPPVWVRLRFA